MFNQILDKITIDDETGDVVNVPVNEDTSNNEEESNAEESDETQESFEIEDEKNSDETEEEEKEEIEIEEEEEEGGEEEKSKDNQDEDGFLEILTSMKEDFFPDASEEEVNQVNTFDDMKKLMSNQFKKELTSYQTNYKKNLINNLLKEGYIDKAQIKNQSDLNISKEDLKDNIEAQKNIIRQDYKNQGMSEKTITKVLDNIIDLEEEALEAYDNLESYKETQALERSKKITEREEAQKLEVQTFNTNLKKEIASLNEMIPNRTLSSNKQEEILININPTLEKIGANPAKYYAVLSYLNGLGVLDGDLNNILKEGESIGTKKLSKILKEKRISSGKTNTKTEKNNFTISNKSITSIYK